MSTSEISNKIDNMSLNDTASVSSKSSTASNAPKTPVSLLQELYVRKGITPKYDLVQIEGAVHEPTFKYRVTVGELVATGCGQSKKKAKHTAAKAMLDKLIAVNNQQSTTAPPKAAKVVELPKDLDAELEVEIAYSIKHEKDAKYPDMNFKNAVPNAIERRFFCISSLKDA